MNDPSNPLYSLKSNYYRNNYGALTGVADELFKLRRFPLFKLLKEMQEELKLKGDHEDVKQQDYEQSESIRDKVKNAFRFVSKVKEEKVLSYKYKQAEKECEEEKAKQRELDAEIGEYSKYSKSNFVNFCKFMMHMERKHHKSDRPFSKVIN
jgi:hypothetical protein